MGVSEPSSSEWRQSRTSTLPAPLRAFLGIASDASQAEGLTLVGVLLCGPVSPHTAVMLELQTTPKR